MIDYRKGIRATLWIGAVIAILCVLSLALWGVLAIAGDYTGAVVARVIALICGIVAALDLTVLVVLLARIQLTMLERAEPHEKG